MHSAREAPLYFWKDATGHEIDVLIDLGLSLPPIEIKSGATLNPSFADALSWWTALPRNPNRDGVLVHGGDVTARLRGFRVLPWHLR